MKRMAIGALCAGVLLAACGGGDASMDTATTEPPVVAVTTTEAGPTTTAPPATTLPETTTTVSLDEQLTQALDAYWAGYYACGADPANCDFSYLAEQGPIREIGAGFIQELIDRGWRLSTEWGDTHWTVESIDVRGDQALVESCVFDEGVVLGPSAPDGSPTIVNDERLSYRQAHTFYREDGTWRVGEERTVEQLGDGDQCGA